MALIERQNASEYNNETALAYEDVNTVKGYMANLSPVLTNQGNNQLRRDKRNMLIFEQDYDPCIIPHTISQLSSVYKF